MPIVPALPAILYEHLVRAALLEDLGRAGDVTTDAIVPAGYRLSATIGARETGAIAGLDIAIMAFQMLDPAIVIEVDLITIIHALKRANGHRFFSQ